MPEEVKDQIEELILCDRDDIIAASGKTGAGVDKILDSIIHKVPPPSGDPKAPLKALIFDSVYNSFRGVIAYFKIEDGSLAKGDEVQFIHTGKKYYADEIGTLRLVQEPKQRIETGDVGYIISGIKEAKEIKVG
jgi:GTP-binding protein LepA